MSWHWVGPLPLSGCEPTKEATRAGSDWRNAVLSEAVGAPLPPRALTVLSSRAWAQCGFSTCSCPWKEITNPPFALASATFLAFSMLSAGPSPCLGGATRLSKIRGELTMAACSGCASGILMTSMRNQAELGSLVGIAATQPDSSLEDRTGEEPEI